MKFYYDMHIHTALSPCADLLLSPNNILNMSSLIGLDIIAITDHNSTLQLEAINKLALSYNFLVINGCELTTKEGYHVLLYFKNYEATCLFQTYLDQFINAEMHDEELYGYQVLFNEYDDEVAHYKKSLRDNTDICITDLPHIKQQFDCLAVLAHIEKYNEKIYTLLEKEYRDIFDAVEVNFSTDIKKVRPLKIKIIRNSDSHQITDILEKSCYLELDELSIDEVFSYFRKAIND